MFKWLWRSVLKPVGKSVVKHLKKIITIKIEKDR